MINYEYLPKFIEFIHKNPFPNKEIIVLIEINSIQTTIHIEIWNKPLNALSKKVTIQLFAPTVNGEWVDVSLPIDSNEYQIMIKTLKNIYENQGLEIDYLLIGNFIIELNKVFPIDSDSLHELLEV
jgi:exonuclease III